MNIAKFEIGRKGEVISRWEDKIAFPERNGPRPNPEDSWEIVAARPQGNVMILSLGKKISGFHFSISLPDGQVLNASLEIQEARSRDGKMVVHSLLFIPENFLRAFPMGAVQIKDGDRWHQTSADSWNKRPGFDTHNVSMFEKYGHKIVCVRSHFLNRDSTQDLAVCEIDYQTCSWAQK